VHAGRPLSVLGQLDPARAGAIVAAVASTLADLHDLGLVHGRIEAGHVLVGDHGRPVLCGFGAGLPPARPEDDVAALGSLLVELVGDGGEEEPIPDHRWRRRRRWSGWNRRSLLLLADQACAEPATRRPSARRFAASIAELAPPLPHDSPTADPAPTPEGVDPMASLRASSLVSHRERPVGVPAIVLALVGIVVLAAGLQRLHAPGRSGRPITSVDPASGETATTRATSPPTAEHSDPREHTGAPLEAGELTVAGTRYRLGLPGDEVLVDDWDCDGTATPALLRPSTGEVFVFPRWIESGETTVSPILQVAGADDLVSDAPAGGCPTLSVRTGDDVLVPIIEAMP
jgi:hypothetical protein